jgi:hypothetical protein
MSRRRFFNSKFHAGSHGRVRPCRARAAYRIMLHAVARDARERASMYVCTHPSPTALSACHNRHTRASIFRISKPVCGLVLYCKASQLRGGPSRLPCQVTLVPVQFLSLYPGWAVGTGHCHAYHLLFTMLQFGSG